MAEGQDQQSTADVCWLRDLDMVHPGVTSGRSADMCEAASVCLDRHHIAPTDFDVDCCGNVGVLWFQWEPPGVRAKAAHAYTHDATKEGAYALSLVSIAGRMGLVAAGEAQGGSGADWYVALPGDIEIGGNGFPNLDKPSIHRLEVSGQNTGMPRRRLREKKQQLLAGHSDIPGIAAVVGFERSVVWMEYAVADGGHDEAI